jgi:hypothetical protein
MIDKKRGPPRGRKPETGLTFHGQTAARDALTAAPGAGSRLRCRCHIPGRMLVVPGPASPGDTNDSCYGWQALCDASRGKGKAATAEVSLRWVHQVNPGVDAS